MRVPSTPTSHRKGYSPRLVARIGAADAPQWGRSTTEVERSSSLLHVPGALELNRLLAGPIHLRDQVDRVLEVAVVRGDPPETEQDEGHRDRERKRPARHGAGGPWDPVLNPGNGHEDPDRHADAQAHRPQHREDPPPS